jgi:hypothetical protein
MAYPSQAQKLRHLLAVAAKLRDLACDITTCESDQDLFLTAAAALEARATWMAAALPDQPYDPAGAALLHHPVNLLV